MKLNLAKRQDGLLEPVDESTMVALVGVPAGAQFQCETKLGKASLSQNSLIHQWYKDWARQSGETISEVSRRCKLCFGVPILRGSDSDYCAMYDKTIKHRYEYSEKLELMDYWPVTRLMGKKDKTLYLETMQKEAALMGVQLHTLEDLAAYG